MDQRILAMGECALLIEFPDLTGVLAADRALRVRWASGQGSWANVEDIVPAARTVLVVATQGADLARLAADVRSTLAEVTTAGGGPETSSDADRLRHAEPEVREAVTIEVAYDGADLAQVARLTGLSEADVVRAHTGTAWQVAFGGFAPGFAYLTGGDPRLTVPRHASPRTTVPTGSVALAGEFSGIYPRASPGGWQLIGTTEAVLWDAARIPPALLRPGAVVRFVAVP